MGDAPACTQQDRLPFPMTITHRLSLLTKAVFLGISCLAPLSELRADLAEVKAAGVLRHAGIPYANFVSGSGDGLDVELMQRFASALGVRYEYVRADWTTLFPAITGRQIVPKGDDIEDLGPVPVTADIAANGITVLEWRKKAVDFSAPTFPTQVWLIASKRSPLNPIKPSVSLEKDIASVRALISGQSLFCKANTCLAPELFDLGSVGATAVPFKGSLNDLAPAVVSGASDLTLLDVPDTLVALGKWPEELKVIGPIGPLQDMCVAFPKTSPELRKAFDHFFAELVAKGDYRKLVEKYYPYTFQYFPEFLAR